MEWEEAKARIKEKVEKGCDLNTIRSKESGYRIVKAVDDEGYKVPIGQEVVITVYWEMLEQCWGELSETNRYDWRVFEKCCSRQRKNHGCYVHVVGKIFEKACLVDSKDDKYYVLKPLYKGKALQLAEPR